VAQRRANFEQYHQKLSGLPGLSFQPEAAGSFSNRWLTGILIDPVQTRGITSETVRLALEKENIEARPLWKPMHMQPVFAEAPYFGGSVAAELFANGLCLPSGSNLSPEDLSRVSTVIRKAFV
jgi:dTDP-4-amino-4,6-dideoxygalactose transaminase